VGRPSTRGEYRGRGGNISNREGNQLGSRRDSNTMDVDRGKGENRTCYIYGR